MQKLLSAFIFFTLKARLRYILRFEFCHIKSR